MGWYVDGVGRARSTDQSLVCPEAMYPILNPAIGGDSGGRTGCEDGVPGDDGRGLREGVAEGERWLTRQGAPAAPTSRARR